MDVTIKREMLEEFVIITGLIGVQFMYAVNSVVLSYLMLLGFKSSSLIILSNFATFLALSPLSIFLERSQWPNSFGLKLWIQLFLISFGGVTLFQSLFLKGINLTSPAMATAMPNLAPGLIFIIAWAVRLEKVELSCIYSKAKILGTFMCVIGALIMSLMQTTVDTNQSQRSSVPAPSTSLPDDHHDNIFFHQQKMVGCIYLMAAVLVLSSTIVLQAVALSDFPAPMSLCAITSFIGVLITTVIQFLRGERWDSGWPLYGVRELIAYTLLAGIIGGGCTSFNTWAMKKRGPVLVAMFSPTGTVISVILSVITLGDTISLGSLAGMFLMFTGLYFVLWAKGKEAFSLRDRGNVYNSEYYDVEKPLLF